MTATTAASGLRKTQRDAQGPRPEGRDRQLVAAQVERLCALGPWQQSSFVLLGGLLVFALAGLVPALYLQSFAALTLAAASIQAFLASRVRKDKVPLEGMRRCGSLLTLTMLLVGLTWGMAGFLFMPLLDDSRANLLALIVLGQVMLALPANAWYLPALLAFVIPTALPLALAFLSAESSPDTVLAAATLVLTLVLTALGWALNREFRESISRQLDDHDYIERLLTGRASENAVQARLETALESMSEALAVFDADDRLVICNRRFFGEQRIGEAKDLVGLTFEEMVRRDVDKAGILDATGREADYIRKRIEYHRKRDGLLEVELADGRWVRIRDRGTRDGGTVIVQTDITAYKHAEEKLRAAKEKAEQASRSKSELLANTSHELRTPLNAIIGFSELMENQTFGPLGSERYIDYARDIRKSGEYLTKIIDDLLDLSKIEAGRLNPAEDTVDLQQALKRVLSITQEQAKARHLTVEVNIASDLPCLRADPRMVQQILVNLVSNAIKFTLENGRVEISMYVDRNGDLVIEISDTGIGMNPEDIERAFEPFGRATGALIRNFEGTGLGLPLSRSLVQLHEGTLELESEPSVGTVVTVRVPAKRVLHKRRAMGA